MSQAPHGGRHGYYSGSPAATAMRLRADRQPEFTQLDADELVEQDDVIAVAEDAVREVWALIDYEPSTHRPHDLPRRHGRGTAWTSLTCASAASARTLTTDTTFRVFQNPYVGRVVVGARGASQSRRTFDAWQEWAKQRGAKGPGFTSLCRRRRTCGPVAKNITDAEREGLAQAAGAAPGDCIFRRRPCGLSRALLGAACFGDRQALRPHRRQRGSFVGRTPPCSPLPS